MVTAVMTRATPRLLRKKRRKSNLSCNPVKFSRVHSCGRRDWRRLTISRLGLKAEKSIHTKGNTVVIPSTARTPSRTMV